MADIKAFKALRFTSSAGDIKDNVCPPYDIISDNERKQLISSSVNNIIRLELPKGEDPYNEASAILQKWISDGILKQDDKDSIYVYEQEFIHDGASYKLNGLICLVKLEEFSKGIVLPHEETLSKAKEDRFNLMSTTYCNFSQVYSMYIDENKEVKNEIDKILSKKPDVDFVSKSDGIIQRLWIESDQAVVENITNAFVDKQLYIADGHHRYETGLNFRNHLAQNGQYKEGDLSGYIMMFLADINSGGLVILPTHRLVKDLVSFDEKDVIKKLENIFDVTEHTGASSIKNELSRYDSPTFAFYVGNETYYILKLKSHDFVEKAVSGHSDAYKELDVTALHSLILEPVFSIDKENMALQKNLTYTRSIEEAVESVDSGKSQCAFILNATKIHQLKDVALAGDKMPQKSTYFYPKLITGLVMNKFN